MIGRLFILILIVSLTACSSANQRGTIAQLRNVEITIAEEPIEGGVEAAIESYEKFLDEAKGTPMAPEAIRRLANLKVEKDYGQIAESVTADNIAPVAPASAPEPQSDLKNTKKPQTESVPAEKLAGHRPGGKVQGVETSVTRSRPEVNVEGVSALEAVRLYRKLLKDYPDYEKNDEVLYQLSRAYEELGKIDEAIEVMNRVVAEYPGSLYIDEVQFRRAEHFFSGRNYVNAEKAYKSVVASGEKSNFYVLALYKLGWTYYKQERYRDALDRYVELLDHYSSQNYDFTRIEDNLDGRQVLDTLRVISLSFSSLDGVNTVVDYFRDSGRRNYENLIYAHLAEYYYNKRRFNDAVETYNRFLDRNPYHRQAPLYSLRVIEILTEGGFPSLVIEAKKTYAKTYAYGSDYWKYFNPDNRPAVTLGLKQNLSDLANHYHALYQDKKLAEQKMAHFAEARHWYREFLDSFPLVPVAPAMNYQLAEMLLENGLFAEAAQEFERTAYSYPVFDKKEQAGHAAVYAYRQHLKEVADDQKIPIRYEVIRVSLKFADYFPKHEKAIVVLAAAADDLFVLKDFAAARSAALKLINNFPDATADLRRSAWLVAAHSAYETNQFKKAEAAYLEVLKLLPEKDKSRDGLIENLAASVYKQGEIANLERNYKKAAEHFLRVATVAPTSTIRATAEYDGAAALIKVEEWQQVIDVLTGFRNDFPNHKLQHDVTKKLAYVYREQGDLGLAAVEFERIAAESDDSAIRQEALMTAAELYENINEVDRAVSVYTRYVDTYTKPIETNLEIRNKLATIYKQREMRRLYLDELRQIVSLEAGADAEQTDRTRYIAGSAALVLAIENYDEFVSVRLVKPFKENLLRKQQLMKNVTETFSQLYDYEISEVTAAATFHLAEIYADFSSSLLKSERPDGMSALELEQYELALEEQAYPFEEKAIEMHQSNLELLQMDVYNNWIEKSLKKLAGLIPARYDKAEAENTSYASPDGFRFENETLYQIALVEAALAAEAEAVRLKARKRKEQDERSQGDPGPESTDAATGSTSPGTGSNSSEGGAQR